MSNEFTTVDFVAKGASHDEWKMVLVEEGPWSGPVQVQLSRVQERLYGCIDAALDGKLAEKFPETSGKNIVIQLDCYNVPRAEVAKFFNSFSKGVFSIDDYRNGIEQTEFVKGITFEINFDSIN